MEDTKVFEIYFSDLNENAQKRLMKAMQISDPNLDMDVIPLATYEFDLSMCW